jgi:hypothetical protein
LSKAILESFDSAAPPQGLTRPFEALWWLKKGGFAMGPEWEQAHQLCQAEEGERAHDLVHALAHWIEGDESNAAYWYRRTNSRRAATIPAEWQRIATELSS